MTPMHAIEPMRVAIVDPYSSGGLLADELVAQGVSCLAIESTPTLPRAMRSKFNPDQFVDVVQHADLQFTVDRVAAHQPSHVIAGFESGVELAEQLADILGLDTNTPSLRAARRDKAIMHEVVSQHGLRTPRQFCSACADELVAWTRANLEWPVIVKPTKSVASGQVARCHTLDEVAAATAAALGSWNSLGLINESAIVQEFLVGTEYALDFVSYGGHSKLTAIWQYQRYSCSDQFVPYDAMQLVDYDGERQHLLKAFAVRVLDAVGIRFGPAHCELMWSNGEPVLIEVGARLSAGINAVLSQACGGIGQMNETVNAVMRPEQFLATVDVQPRLNRYAVNVFLRPHRNGRLAETRHIDRLEGLPTLDSLSLARKPGTTLNGVSGRITLVSPEAEAIQRDLAVIQELEGLGIFQLLEEPIDLTDDGG